MPSVLSIASARDGEHAWFGLLGSASRVARNLVNHVVICVYACVTPCK
jgi:hypothetical protein